MDVHIREIHSAEAPVWDAYVQSHPQSTLYHLYGWRNIIRKTYGHSTHYLAAIKDVPSTPSTHRHPPSGIQILGLLPLVHLKHFLFGNRLISMPFFDLGGILADDEEIEKALFLHAIKLGKKLRSASIELRHAHPLSCLNSRNLTNAIDSTPVVIRSHKVRMLLDLPDSSAELMDSFKSKLRSQIRKPKKEGLTTRIGKAELLTDFYTIFSINMRELGSPVHSIKLMGHVVEEFPGPSRIIAVYQGDRPMAAALIVHFKDTLENPWASSLREYSRLSPNMLLYWSMLEYACDNGLAQFDFGRSTPDEGTYRFKKQWGANPNPLYWYSVLIDGRQSAEAPDDKSRFKLLIRYWQKLPVPFTQVIGPRIRKHIGL